MKKRNGKIELLRFVCCAIIVLRHSSVFTPNGIRNLFSRGALGVEFFFFVSGYLMAVSAAKKRDVYPNQLGRETSQFIGRKITALMPHYLIAWFVAFAITEISKRNFNLYKGVQSFLDQIWELLFVSYAGFGPINASNSVVWYISAMLIAMAILYPLCRKYYDMYIHVIAPLIGVIIVGYLFRTTDTTLSPATVIGPFYKGLWRAFAEISLGAAGYPIVQAMKRLNLKRFAKCTISVAEIACWAFAVMWMQYGDNRRFDVLAALCIYAAVLLAFTEQGSFAECFNKKWCYALGKISLSLYLCHIAWGRAVNREYGRWLGEQLMTYSHEVQYIILLVIYVGLSLITAIAVEYISEYLKRNSAKILEWTKSRFLYEAA